jgi:hypothetical protein
MPPKKTIFYSDNLGNREQGSEPVDATALDKALKDIEEAGRQRERTPGIVERDNGSMVIGKFHPKPNAGAARGT